MKEGFSNQADEQMLNKPALARNRAGGRKKPSGQTQRNGRHMSGFGEALAARDRPPHLARHLFNATDIGEIMVSPQGLEPWTY